MHLRRDRIGLDRVLHLCKIKLVLSLIDMIMSRYNSWVIVPVSYDDLIQNRQQVAESASSSQSQQLCTGWIA